VTAAGQVGLGVWLLLEGNGFGVLCVLAAAFSLLLVVALRPWVPFAGALISTAVRFRAVQCWSERCRPAVRPGLNRSKLSVGPHRPRAPGDALGRGRRHPGPGSRPQILVISISTHRFTILVPIKLVLM
jgi:hypothetical protein